MVHSLSRPALHQWEGIYIYIHALAIIRIAITSEVTTHLILQLMCYAFKSLKRPTVSALHQWEDDGGVDFSDN